MWKTRTNQTLTLSLPAPSFFILHRYCRLRLRALHTPLPMPDLVTNRTPIRTPCLSSCLHSIQRHLPWFSIVVTMKLVLNLPTQLPLHLLTTLHLAPLLPSQTRNVATPVLTPFIHPSQILMQRPVHLKAKSPTDAVIPSLIAHGVKTYSHMHPRLEGSCTTVCPIFGRKLRYCSIDLFTLL